MVAGLRMVVLAVLMLVSWVTAASAITPTCSNTTTLTSFGTFSSTSADGSSISINVPADMSLARNDRISNMRIVWSFDGPASQPQFLSGGVGFTNAGTSFLFPINVNATSGSIDIASPSAIATLETPITLRLYATGLTPTPAPTTRLQAQFFLQCVPAPPEVPTSTTVSSDINPSNASQFTTIQARVQSASGTPTGEVDFFVNGTRFNSAPLSNGVATMSGFSPTRAGANSIVAKYRGHPGFSPSESTSFVQTVQNFPASVTVTSSVNPANIGEEVTFTAAVSSINDVVPAGRINFYIDDVKVGTVDLNPQGAANFMTSSLSVGEHNVQAQYLSLTSDFLSTELTDPPFVQAVNTAPATNNSTKLDDVQEAATGVAAVMASENITEGVADELNAALSGQVQVLSASDGQVGFVYAPGIGKSIIIPTADLASGATEIATWRIWSSLRYSKFDSVDLEGDQLNALLGTTFLFGDGLVAGLVAGYESQGYKDDASATLKGEGFNIGGYAGGTLGNGLRFDAQVHTSFLNYDLASGPVTGSTDGKRLMLSGGFAHMMQFGATTIEPMARFNGTWEWQDGYTDSAAVDHRDRDFNFGRVATGAKLAHRIDMGDGASFSPFVEGYADYRFSGGDFTNESLLDGLSARVGLGASISTASGINASVLAEFAGLGLDNSVMVQSYKAQIAIPF